MTDFVTPSPVTDGDVCFDDRWNQDVVDNTIALYEKLPNFFPHVQVGNTAVETELFRHTIPAGALGTKGFVVAELAGIFQNTSGSAAAPILRYYLGATAIHGFAPAIPTGANRVLVRYTCRIQNLTANSQLHVTDFLRNATAVPDGTLATMTAEGSWGAQSIDTTVELDLIATLSWGTAHATRIFDMAAAHVIGPIYKD